MPGCVVLCRGKLPLRVKEAMLSGVAVPSGTARFLRPDDSAVLVCWCLTNVEMGVMTCQVCVSVCQEENERGKQRVQLKLQTVRVVSLAAAIVSV